MMRGEISERSTERRDLVGLTHHNAEEKKKQKGLGSR